MTGLGNSDMSTIGGSDNSKIFLSFEDSDLRMRSNGRTDLDPFDLSHLDFSSSEAATKFDEEMEDLSEAAQLARRSFRHFAATEEGAEIIGYVLDGNLREGRSPEAQLVIDQITGDLARPDNVEVTAETTFHQPEFILIPSDANVADGIASLPSGIRAAIVFPKNKPAQILVASGLGLKDTLLISQEAYADAIAGYAETVGVELASGDIGARLTESLRLGSGIAGVEHGGNRPRGEILMEGELLDAVFR
ncbi:hypothetical protein AAD018_001375 [Aestuariibius insulae]|uniref:hypothetical protein n=1 Tax=Aestuariibius insulae TaxID=2058287 RepID=UPI00398E699C